MWQKGFPPACFKLNKQQKIMFCIMLKHVKVLDGYLANISWCVNVDTQHFRTEESQLSYFDATIVALAAGHTLLRKLVHSSLVYVAYLVSYVPNQLLEISQLQSRISLSFSTIFPLAFIYIYHGAFISTFSRRGQASSSGAIPSDVPYIKGMTKIVLLQ